jgi:rfaE bifunctional protein nucleotidyltransferase chain/domain
MPPSPTLPLDQLIVVVDDLKAQGKTIVTTNGCFDLMHVGHLRYLQASKAQGDVLIVALNSDASVKLFKDDERPIIQQDERAELLAALECVDYVTIFDALTPIDVLKAIQPDVHTKGGQYTLDTLPEAPDLQAMGTRIEFIEMVDGKSTSQVIEKVLRAYGPSKA